MQELHMFILFCIFFAILFASIICLCKRLRDIPTEDDLETSSSNYYYQYSPFIIPVQSTPNNELGQETLSNLGTPTYYGSTLMTTETTNEQLCTISNCPQQISSEQNCTRQNCPQQISSQQNCSNQNCSQQMCQHQMQYHQIYRYSTMSKNNQQRRNTPPPSYEEAMKLPQLYRYHNYPKY